MPSFFLSSCRRRTHAIIVGTSANGAKYLFFISSSRPWLIADLTLGQLPAPAGSFTLATTWDWTKTPPPTNPVFTRSRSAPPRRQLLGNKGGEHCRGDADIASTHHKNPSSIPFHRQISFFSLKTTTPPVQHSVNFLSPSKGILLLIPSTLLPRSADSFQRNMPG